eukprot:585299-Amphidinium_carterae.1
MVRNVLHKLSESCPRQSQSLRELFHESCSQTIQTKKCIRTPQPQSGEALCAWTRLLGNFRVLEQDTRTQTDTHGRTQTHGTALKVSESGKPGSTTMKYLPSQLREHYHAGPQFHYGPARIIEKS